MTNNKFIELLKRKEHLVSDGATGSNLISRGLPRGMSAEAWMLENPDKIMRLHKDFINAGADIILTCTFGGSEIMLEHAGLAHRFAEVNSRAVEIAKKASNGKDVLIAGSLGPLGRMIKPFGTLTVEESESQYFNQAEILMKSGVDLLLIETQFDLNESMAGIRAARNASDLPIICSFSFDRGTKTMMGIGPTQFASEMSKTDIKAIGINCGKSLEENTHALEELAQHTKLPIWFKPNAGIPTLDEDNNPKYDISPKDMGAYVEKWKNLGAKIIGGCCGTTPEHLQEIAAQI